MHNVYVFGMKRAHLAITDLTVTSERESGCDFTMPFMNLGKLNVLVLQSHFYFYL